MFSMVYAFMVENADQEGRKKINALYHGRLGPGGGVIVDDPTLPESLRGQEAPSWWDDDHNAFSEQHVLSNTEQRRQ